MIMNNLEIAKAIVMRYLPVARCGIFNTRNVVGDDMNTLYDKDGLTVDICFGESYFEVFGLTDEEFLDLKEFYEITGEIQRKTDELVESIDALYRKWQKGRRV